MVARKVLLFTLNTYVFMERIIENQEGLAICKFAFGKTECERKGIFRFVGKNLCGLTQDEKKHPLVAKFLQSFRQPSAKELSELNANFKVAIVNGVCHLFADDDAGIEEVADNLGTVLTPAFAYQKFLFVFNKKKKVFEPVEVDILYLNNNYLLLVVGDLLLRFDKDSLSRVGNFVSLTQVPEGVVVVALNEKSTESVFAFCENIHLLFRTKPDSRYEIDHESGKVTHEYALKVLRMAPREDLQRDEPAFRNMKDIYAIKGKGYVLISQTFC